MKKGFQRFWKPFFVRSVPLRITSMVTESAPTQATRMSPSFGHASGNLGGLDYTVRHSYNQPHAKDYIRTGHWSARD